MTLLGYLAVVFSLLASLGAVVSGFVFIRWGLAVLFSRLRGKERTPGLKAIKALCFFAAFVTVAALVDLIPIWMGS